MENVSYSYDGLNRLIRENNLNLDLTYVYEYDGKGDITKIRKYEYTTNVNIPSEPIETLTYTYSGGKLVKVAKSNGGGVGEYAISDYENFNPCNYKGNVLEWSRKKDLTKYGNNSYKYNVDGIRQEKSENGAVHKYWTEGSRIHRESITKNGTTSDIWYYYDGSGAEGFTYGGNRYHYRKNLLGDITAILNDNGEVIARYIYDGYGNHKVLNSDGIENVSATFIGNVNPIRYRGYYYYKETRLYYLNSRYYDPETGRFINADDVSYIDPETINGLNLYAYCFNDPVMYKHKLLFLVLKLRIIQLVME